MLRDLPRDHDDIVLLLLRLCRQTTTMYGRPEEFASSCLWAFFRDNSIIPTRCGRLISKGFALKSFSGRFRLFLFYDSLKRENFWRSRRLYHTAAIDISSLCGKKAWLTRVAHGRDHFKFLPRSVDFKYGHRKWNAENDGASLFNRHIPRAVGLISQA